FVVALVTAKEAPIVCPSKRLGDARQDVPVGLLLLREGSLFPKGDLPLLNNRLPSRPELTLGKALLEKTDGLLERPRPPLPHLSDEHLDLFFLALRNGHHCGDAFLNQFEICLVEFQLL